MHYIIDGYNLLFRHFDADEELQQKRERFLESFRTKVSQLPITVTLVFDAQHQLGEATRSGYGDLKIIFTDSGVTADEHIIYLAKNSPKSEKLVVVTSDKLLAREVRRLGAETQTGEEFLAWLNKRYQNSLRKEKIEKKIVPLKAIPKVISEEKQQQKRKKPGKNATFAECFEYYLEIFKEKE